ncbi:MAG TPA: molybdenum ABC transporter ATP-binding protein [Rhizomicrobium sp.]|jgi:molybdate transport system ATP-binding protein|nr:molybdenum ABC transporter ATP-binding protein [Rhizomicrobium sp.]
MSAEVAIRHRQGTFLLDVAFTAGPGVTALFGPSGAGKTSIVHVLAGLTRPDQGRIVLEGHTVLDTQKGVFVPPEKRRAGLVFQDARLFPHMNVETNLLFGWRRMGKRADQAEIARIIRLLGLEALLQRAPKHLSGGEKSRVALGRALLATPDILLLDEPLAGLDQQRRAEILPWLERLRDIARVPIFYVSHSLDEVARLADQVVLLDKGKVAGFGSVFEVLAGHGAEKPLGAVLEATVSEKEGDLTTLMFDGGKLLVAEAGEKGKKLRVRIRADDILIAREAPTAISANNILPAIISEIVSDGARAEIAMRCGSAWLVARVTAASVRRLELAKGMQVFAVIKSVTVEGA